MSGERRPRVVVATPFLNPTVEIEMRRLLPDDVDYLVTRLTSSADDPRQRLRDYFEQLPDLARQLKPLGADAWLFACTGSSYLVPRARADDLLGEAREVLGVPVHAACEAIRWWLARAGRRLAMLVPYPDWLAQPAFDYWREAGFELVLTRQLAHSTGDDTLGIYALGDDAAAGVGDELTGAGADAVVVSGTGMPTLEWLTVLRGTGQHAVSSNVALASRFLDAIGRADDALSAASEGPRG